MKRNQIVRLLIIVVVGVVGVVGVMVFKAQKRASQGPAMLREAQEMIAFADVYRTNKDYVDGLVTFAHPAALRESGGGLFGPAVDRDTYFTALYNGVVRQAKDQNQPELARSLRTFAVGKGFIDVTDR